jgi:hypothetical protein
MRRSAKLPAFVRIEIKDFPERGRKRKGDENPIGKRNDPVMRKCKSITLYDTNFLDVISLVEQSIDKKISIDLKSKEEPFDKSIYKEIAELNSIAGEAIGFLSGILLGYDIPDNLRIKLTEAIYKLSAKMNKTGKSTSL